MFQEHAGEELDHFTRVSDRISQLGGSPDESDPTSRRLIEEILKEEEDHADELNDLYRPSSS